MEKSKYDGIENAQVGRSGVYLGEGQHTLEVMEIKDGTTRKGIGYFVAEFRVLKSTLHPEGSTCSWFVSMDKDAALGNIKAFTAALTGSTLEEVKGDVVEYIAGAKNPMKGKKISADAAVLPTKKGGKYTRVNWISELA